MEHAYKSKWEGVILLEYVWIFLCLFLNYYTVNAENAADVRESIILLYALV